ncbi:MAG: hypothetical protein ACTFAL_00270 [Candidatus Electronema sp. V4]|uniref:hypothetical protein n=1 Tax=Candidatus Electronema sp. V4 TaxID=3454756 RepID=UPI0040555B5C
MKKMISKLRNVYVPAVAGAISAGFATANAYALAWPPTAADITTEFTDIGDDIGLILAASVTVGLVLYGGVLAVQAAIGFFSKFVKRSTAG